MKLHFLSCEKEDSPKNSQWLQDSALLIALGVYKLLASRPLGVQRGPKTSLIKGNLRKKTKKTGKKGINNGGAHRGLIVDDFFNPEAW